MGTPLRLRSTAVVTVASSTFPNWNRPISPRTLRLYFVRHCYRILFFQVRLFSSVQSSGSEKDLFNVVFDSVPQLYRKTTITAKQNALRDEYSSKLSDKWMICLINTFVSILYRCDHKGRFLHPLVPYPPPLGPQWFKTMSINQASTVVCTAEMDQSSNSELDWMSRVMHGTEYWGRGLIVPCGRDGTILCIIILSILKYVSNMFF